MPEQDVEREAFLGIRDRLSRELVAVVELLSPANKRYGENREKYLAKRSSLLNSPVHLVEIDLLREVPRCPAEPPGLCILRPRQPRRGAAPG